MTFNELKNILIKHDHDRFTIIEFTGKHEVLILTRKMISTFTVRTISNISGYIIVRYGKLPWYKNIFKKIQHRRQIWQKRK